LFWELRPEYIVNHRKRKEQKQNNESIRESETDDGFTIGIAIRRARHFDEGNAIRQYQRTYFDT
jgi:hypothetical protein